MIRLFLVVIVILASTLAGYCKSYAITQRYKSLCEISAALEVLKTKIAFFGCELCAGLESASEHSFVKELFCDAATFAKSKGASEGWVCALEKNAKSLELTKEDLESLKTLSKRLGMTDSLGQEKNIEATLCRLQTNLVDAKTEKDKYSSLYIKGGALVGVFLGLMIL